MKYCIVNGNTHVWKILRKTARDRNKLKSDYKNLSKQTEVAS